MITIFICKDDAISKEITQKYLDRESLAYVNMLDGITYEQAVRAIEGLEKSVEDQVDEIYVGKPKEEEGWTPIAITEECLKPSENELAIVVGYSRLRDAKGTETELCSEMRFFTINEVKRFIKKWKLTPISEKDFNIMFKK